MYYAVVSGDAASGIDGEAYNEMKESKDASVCCPHCDGLDGRDAVAVVYAAPAGEQRPQEAPVLRAGLLQGLGHKASGLPGFRDRPTTE